MSATINRPAITQEINYDSIFIMFKILKPIINVKTGLNWAFSGEGIASATRPNVVG